MSKKFFLIVLTFVTLTITVQAGEKITDFKFVYNGPEESRVYLVDENRATDYGHFSIRPFISYSENNFVYSGLSFGTMSIDDMTLGGYNGKVETKYISNLSKLYYTYNSFMIATIIGGSLGVSGIIAGASMLGYSTTENTEYKQVLSYYDWMGNPIYTEEKETTRPYSYLLTPGMITLIAGSALFVLSAALFLPIFLYNYIVYKRVKTELLNMLNGFEVSNNNKKLFRLKFDLVLG